MLKGANSVLYGADALAGVVNVTTQRGTSSTPELQVSSDGGNFGTHFESAVVFRRLRAVRLLHAVLPFRYGRKLSKRLLPQLNVRGQFRLEADDSHQRSCHLSAKLDRPWHSQWHPFYGIEDQATQRNNNTYLSATVQNQTTSRWHNLFRFAYGQFDSTYVDPGPVGQLDSYGDYLGNVVTIKGANGYSVTGQAILDYAGTYPEVSPDYEARRSAYWQSDYQITGDWTATGGFRYEHEDGEGFKRNNYSYFIEGHGDIRHRLYLTGGLGLENNAVFGFAASREYQPPITFGSRPAVRSFPIRSCVSTSVKGSRSRAPMTRPTSSTLFSRRRSGRSSVSERSAPSGARISMQASARDCGKVEFAWRRPIFTTGSII